MLKAFLDSGRFIVRVAMPALTVTSKSDIIIPKASGRGLVGAVLSANYTFAKPYSLLCVIDLANG